MAKNDKGEGQTGGIQSLDAALRLLVAMMERRGPVSLSELARDCRMPPSKVHRYLASFQHASLVEQAGRSGKYDLGPGAVTLGLSALARHDFVNRASDALPDLCTESGLTTLLSVWGNQGATVIRWERAASPTVTSMGLGTTLPLLNSATGRAFLAWAPQAPLQAIRDAELRHARKNPAIAPDVPADRDIDKLVETIRAKGYASVEGKFIPGLVAIAAPILDWQGEAQAVVTLIGTDPSVVQPGSEAVKRLIAFCEDLSFAPMTMADAK
ncbi:Transcriptional regulator, IclR family (plasmid) [Sinorhizobium sojae CCBAU 05684]|uniref:Transcriptional regulator, IclR family n=1 Tax=Sinorhizobium sojae CCBAU 05684 TaxID=716928 RepID=A0A249PH44_9HYPH|nr:IclR family transcriptional regulator [Sinorhizobium sojae]ASY65270.1 Transcriptional regulator, IclR family [Sinorhizobium sojae CCBAU 05684]